jgi:hypothetical protein
MWANSNIKMQKEKMTEQNSKMILRVAFTDLH